MKSQRHCHNPKDNEDDTSSYDACFVYIGHLTKILSPSYAEKGCCLARVQEAKIIEKILSKDFFGSAFGRLEWRVRGAISDYWTRVRLYLVLKAHVPSTQSQTSETKDTEFAAAPQIEVESAFLVAWKKGDIWVTLTRHCIFDCLKCSNANSMMSCRFKIERAIRPLGTGAYA